ncbi:helix-turn-helix transcriptional regulator [Flavobacterium sp. SUN052]|uniref:helix-turn-helix domain-containing protein n=1 Tax=Flavobacterium sp. SUN052 TaxID=3002441 RepID=UPI00237E294A|nr:helix-turn-helix transcriptional regulator [Flavobacterium sp. SUN052]MEC4003727.1 helix-turn-helix transcriptional regulator [Flavobacterium sp. SUN052]
MESTEKLEDFYIRKYGATPKINPEIGHFNVFQLEPVDPDKAKPLPYRRRDFYKVMLVIGNIDVHYADKVFSVKKQAIVFSNPQIPYKCEPIENIKSGSYCVFNQTFIQHFGDLKKYAVFQPNGNHVFELIDEQVDKIQHIYNSMLEEINSEYIHKYDVLKNKVFDLLHFAMKIDDSAKFTKQTISASNRIYNLFLELLERQFPIEENHLKIKLRTASDFANQLNIHVNHLNKAVKLESQKTTTQIIAERILQESKILLKQSNWNVSEISEALNFTETTHFNNFFKKQLNVSPLQYRKF